jgi:hypothetical protein
MPDLPARRIDDRELRAELALAGEIVGEAPCMVPRRSQPCFKIHNHESSE